jgi:hypothetical protein
MTQPLHKSQHTKNLGNTRIAYKPRTCVRAHARAHTHARTHTRNKKKHRWQLVTATHKPQHAKGPKYQYKTHTNTQWHTDDE